MCNKNLVILDLIKNDSNMFNKCKVLRLLLCIRFVLSRVVVFDKCDIVWCLKLSKLIVFMYLVINVKINVFILIYFGNLEIICFLFFLWFVFLFFYGMFIFMIKNIFFWFFIW